MSADYVTPGHPVKEGQAGYDCACGECLAIRAGYVAPEVDHPPCPFRLLLLASWVECEHEDGQGHDGDHVVTGTTTFAIGPFETGETANVRITFGPALTTHMQSHEAAS